VNSKKEMKQLESYLNNTNFCQRYKHWFY